MRINPPTKIYVSKSDIHGYGVFAKEMIFEGEIIEECPIHNLNIPYGHSTPLFIDYRFNWPQGTESWNKQVISWGYGSLYNHSKTPNAYWRSNMEKETFEFCSLKTINPEEEILVYYGGDSYWSDGRTHTEIK
jgi:SET domain-containing protein